MATLKVLVCFALLALVKTAAAELDFKCTSEVSMHPHYDKCNKFYMCQNEKVFIDTCPGGQLFDAPSRVCVNRSLAICAQRPTTTDSPTTDSPTTEPGFQCGVMFGSFPMDEQCDRYYECFNFLPYNRTCPQGSLFDQQMQKCLDYTQVDCGQRVIPEGVTSSLGFKCTKEITFHPHYYDCSKYYMCQNEKAYINSCAKDQRFDAPSGSCVESSKAICAQLPTTTETPTTVTQEYCGVKSGNFTDDEHCDRYYECIDFASYHRICPQGSLFNHESMRCLDYTQVDCGKSVIPEGVTTSLGFKCTKQITVHPNYYDCTKFFLCKDEKAYTNYCYEDRLFDAPSGSCVESLKADCAGYETTEASFTTAAPFKCVVKQGTFFHEELCERYYECYNWLPYNRACPPGRLFDQNRKQCLEETKADCGNRIRPSWASSREPDTTTPFAFTTEDAISWETTEVEVEPEATTETAVTTEEEVEPETTTEEEVEQETTTEEEAMTETESYTTSEETATSMEPEFTELTTPEPVFTEHTTPEPERTEQFTTTEKATTTTEKITTKPTTPKPKTTTKKPIITTEGDDSGEFVDLECPKPDGRFPHPKNPHQFIVCIGNYPHLMDCPADLVFDPSKEVCIWKGA